MKLAQLFENVEIIASNESILEKTVSGLSNFSKNTKKGDLFIAKSGKTFQGNTFAKEAISKGAVAVLTNRFIEDLKCPQIIVSDPISIEGHLADRFFGSPSQKIFLIGVTGTNGKTTTCYLTRQLLDKNQCGLIGTIEYCVGLQSQEATLTTPDVLKNHQLFAQMIQNNLPYCVMEATSIALTQNRLDEIDFDLAVFTNLSQDHLDYHGTMEKYLQAKSLLFEQIAPHKRALINIDDPVSLKLIKKCKAPYKTYGYKKGADYQIIQEELSANGCFFKFKHQGELYEVSSKLIGKFNVYNLMCSIACAHLANQPLTNLVKKALFLQSPDGRLEKVENQIGAHIFIDFSHTPEALKVALETLKEIKTKRLIVVFGCGGDRDQSKRLITGRVASRLADFSVITSDNPRSENPRSICEQIERGFDNCSDYIIEVDRKKAIFKALEMLKEDDILLVAGRGHETHQKIEGLNIPFKDKEITLQILKEQLTPR